MEQKVRRLLSSNISFVRRCICEAETPFGALNSCYKHLDSSSPSRIHTSDTKDRQQELVVSS